MNSTLAEVSAMLGGAPVWGEASFDGVGIDSRGLEPGSLFAAIKGEFSDGEVFLEQAKRAGAAAALVSTQEALRACMQLGLPCIQAPNVVASVQGLAGIWRSRFEGQVIGVAGGNGKTTVSSMCAHILRGHFGSDRVHATSGNSNNRIGAPLTLLGLRSHHRVAVVELGIGRPGDMDLLARACAPDVALVNNAQREHLEFFGTMEASALENGKLFASLPKKGVAVMPQAGPFRARWLASCAGRAVAGFGHGQADFQIQARWSQGRASWSAELAGPEGPPVEFELGMPGEHNLLNAAAAAACAFWVGASMDSIQAGLAGFQAAPGRSSLERLLAPDGTCQVLVDDTYNANPDSVDAAIRQLSALPAPRWLILGDMGEAGPDGARLHAEAGRAAREAGIEWVWTAGPLSDGSGTRPGCLDARGIVSILNEAPAAKSILVKGSRSMGMERVVQAIRTLAAP